MNRKRQRNDGLPYRVYQRHGVRDFSIGYKGKDGKWVFRLSCDAKDRAKVSELRREAIQKAAQIDLGAPAQDSVTALIDAWIKRQDDMPPSSADKRAESTLAENKRECAMLKRAFGHMRVTTLEKFDAYAYLDACVVAKDGEGNPRPRAAKGNKEISLMRTILEYGIRIDMVKANAFADVEKLKTNSRVRLVTDAEMALTLEIGRRLGSTRLIVALALRTAWLCVRRSVEVRALTRPQITDEGIVWQAAKRRRGEVELQGLIEWSPELRATIDEALTIERNNLAGSWYLFGNLNGQCYTKGGWKATLAYLMRACVEEAQKRNVPFRPFSLQDCRPKGVTDKLKQKDTDVMDATMHTNERMIQKVYDLRRVRIAKPVR